eukprot:GFUD01038327.1.p1 GENE.GFUD01038327.1~~GFUD01038327.1.p1  ORF type:complete len:249 (+),score=55.94 GFUD01038327.1:171-917(+)
MAEQVAVNPATPAVDNEKPMVAKKTVAIEKPKVAKKTVSAAKSRVSGNPTYSAMVTKAIIELKEKKGSSRHSILQYMLDNFEVEKSAAQPLLNRAIKKMSTARRLVPGALPGRNGAGCFKLSVEETQSIKQAEKAAIKKMAQAGKKMNKGAEGTAAKKMGAKKGVVKKTGAKVSNMKTAAKSKKVGMMKTGAKVMKKVSKVVTGAKMKKGSAKPKKAMKKVTKVATGAKVKKGSAKPKKVAKKAGAQK